MNLDRTAVSRLAAFLAISPESNKIIRLTPDASTREFFRVPWQSSSAIACVYPHKIDDSLPQIDVTGLFLECGLPVARIYDTNFDFGIVIHEDFGDRILKNELNDPETNFGYLKTAIQLIARIHAGTAVAFERGSIASRLKFDEEKLLWELEFFRKHYFESLKKRNIDAGVDSLIAKEFTELSRELESFASVLTHRDYHSANLMISEGELKIIDHQDARIGPVSYDLVSLLLDRIDVPPSDAFVAKGKQILIDARMELGIEPFDRLDYEFELVTIQRCLKAIGTFSNQAENFGKKHYLKFIDPMFRVVALACRRLGRFENIRAMVENEL